jgi:hypothetical protein
MKYTKNDHKVNEKAASQLSKNYRRESGQWLWKLKAINENLAFYPT